MTHPIFQADLLKDQSAIVTGGGTGIGKAIAKTLLQLGCDVTIASRKAQNLEPAAEELSQFGRVRWQTCDIRQPEQVTQLVEGHLAAFEKLHILVNNGGGQFPLAAEMISPNGWAQVIHTNLNGTFYLTREAANRAFIPQQYGRVVSIVANMWRGFPGMSHTGAARAGVVNLTQSLSVEWAPHNILVNAVAPGIIDSSGMAHYDPEFRKQFEGSVPLKRLGTVDDVAHAVAYLVSPAGQYITGATLCVDGGQAHWGSLWQIP